MRRLLAAALTAATVAGILPLQALAGTSQTITWTSVAPANAAVGGAPYTPTATATSGLPVDFTIDPASAGACSISAGEVTFQHVGTCTVDANQSGDSAWDPAPQDPQAFAVAQGTQTVSITSSAPASPVVGGTYPVTASATSGLTPSITIDTSAAAVCSVAGALVTFDHVGTCVVDANQSGDTDWAAAAQNQQSIVVGQAAQSISFTSTPSSPTVGGPTYSVGATGGNSGNSVTFAIDAASVAYCSIAGTTVSFEHVGTCVIDADQAGNTDYLDAPQKQQTFAIGKGSQTITFTSTAPTAAVVGGTPYAPAATGGATGNPVTFSIAPATAAHCSISGGNVSMDHAGACTVDADQAGNADYNAGSNSQSFSIGLATQTLSFTTVAPAATVDGATYTPAATSTAGLTVSLSVDAGSAGVCTMTAGVVSFQHAGTCVIDANQPGNADYGAATQVQQNVTVGPAEQTITFTSTAPSDAKVGGSTYTVTATGGGSNNPILLTIDAASAGACTMAGAVVSFAHAGSCVIDANQAGTADFNAATQEQQTFAVARGDQTISITSAAPADAKVGGPGYGLTAIVSSGLTPALSIDLASSGACSLTGSTVSFLHVGTCIVDANQPGNADWNAASLDQQSFPIGKGDQAVTFTSIDPTPVNIGDTYTPTATSGSGLTVSFSIAPASGTICSIGTANLVTFHAVGDCVINGDQGGDADWNPAATKAFQIGVGDRKPVCAPATPVAVTMNLAATGPSNCSDPDLQPLTYSIGTDGTKGHATINAAGTWTYTPNAKQTGSDSFTVVANDSIIDSDAATVSVTITNHFDPRNDGVTLVATVTTQVDVLANDSGGSGQPLTIKAVGQGTLGTVTTDGHVVTYHPNGCAVGTDVFTYTVSDGLTTSVPKSVFVTIARPGTSDGLGGTLPLAPVTDTPGIGFITGSTIGSTTPMRLGWCSVVAPTTSFWYYRVVQSTNGGVTWPALATMTAATSMTLNLGGYRYVWGVRAVDRVGRSSSYATSVSARVFRVQDTGTTAIAYRGSWGTVKSTAYSGGTERWATSVAATATYRTTTAARAFAIVASKASNRGSFRVYVDGILVATVSERTSTALYRNVVYARLLSPGVAHTIIIKPAGTGRIDIDAILTLG